MITSITADFLNSDSSILTSQLSDVSVHTDYESVVYRIMSYGEGHDQSILFMNTAYAANGYATICSFSDIIEDWLRKLGRISGSFRVYVGSEDNLYEKYVDFDCIYCDYALPNNFDIDKCFYSTVEVAKVHLDSLFSIVAGGFMYPPTFTISAMYFDADGNRGVESMDVMAMDSTGRYPYGALYSSVSAIYDQLNTVLAEKNITLAKLIMFVVTYGEKQKQFFLDYSPRWQLFRYRNIFNALEYCEVVGTTTTKTDVSTDSAVVGGVTIQYNHLATRTYAVETAALLHHQANAIDQLFNSRDIALIDTNGEELPIIITEHTCEISDTDEQLQTVKFTWRFADERPRLLAEVANMHPAAGVFSDVFNLNFV
jgi:hypothetical protein